MNAYSEARTSVVYSVGGSGREGRSVKGVRVRILPTPFRSLGKFVYPTLPNSLGMCVVYKKRLAVGVNPKRGFCQQMTREITKSQCCYVIVTNTNFMSLVEQPSLIMHL